MSPSHLRNGNGPEVEVSRIRYELCFFISVAAFQKKD